MIPLTNLHRPGEVVSRYNLPRNIMKHLFRVSPPIPFHPGLTPPEIFATSICPPEAAAHRQYSRAPRRSAAAERILCRAAAPSANEGESWMNTRVEHRDLELIHNWPSWSLTRLNTIRGRCMYTLTGGCKPTYKWETPSWLDWCTKQHDDPAISRSLEDHFFILNIGLFSGLMLGWCSDNPIIIGWRISDIFKVERCWNPVFPTVTIATKGGNTKNN